MSIPLYHHTAHDFPFSGHEKEGPQMWIGGVRTAMKEFPASLNNKAIKALTKKKIISTAETEKYLAMEAACWDRYSWPNDLLALGKKYPDVTSLACIKLAGDLSDERIDGLLTSDTDHASEDLHVLLKALIAAKDTRARNVAMRIAKSEGLVDLWEDAFQYLATIQSDEIEAFFIQFLINDEKNRPYLTRIADAYLMTRG